MAHSGDQNTVEPVFRVVKRRMLSFSNTFGDVEPRTAESRPQVLAAWWNRRLARYDYCQQTVVSPPTLLLKTLM